MKVTLNNLPNMKKLLFTFLVATDKSKITNDFPPHSFTQFNVSMKMSYSHKNFQS
jgi:hypothetical protein